MQQDQDIKGFSLLELLVVIAIVGLVSAVGYPNFSKWNKERKVRSGMENIFSQMNKLVSQTQSGNYPYVKYEIDCSDLPCKFTSKGMKKETFSKAIYEKKIKLDCSDRISWDNSKINIFEGDDIATHFISEKGGVCFSQNGRYYSTVGKIDKNENLTIEGSDRKNWIVICSKDDFKDTKVCPGKGSFKKEEIIYLISWSRFGSVSKYKWDGNEWVRR